MTEVLDNGVWVVPDDSMWTTAGIRAKDTIVIDELTAPLEEGAVVLARYANGRQIGCGLFRVTQVGRSSDRLLLAPLAGGALVAARLGEVLGRVRALVRAFKAPESQPSREAVLRFVRGASAFARVSEN